MTDLTGRGNGEVVIGAVTVRGSWRFSYPGQDVPQTLRFIINLPVGDRKKLVNLKKGDRTELTAGPFRELPVSLQDLDYDDGGRRVSLTFTANTAV